MLSKSFKPAKCKMSLKLAIARIKLLKNKREVLLKQMKRDLAKLLESGQEQTARIRVEHVVREEKTMAAYDIIELYCELIVTRLPMIEAQKNCPIDLKESIASVIFASPRCADIPELLDVRKHLTKKYGKEFVTAALELRPDSGVNHTIIEKLSAKTPDGETKIKILTAIAQEHNVKWDPSASEEQLLKPREDLLNGPSKFVSASSIHVESPNIQVQPPPQKYEPATQSYENDVSRSSQTSRPVSANMGAPVSKPSTFTRDPGASGGITEGEEFGHSFSEDATSLNRRNRNMEFKDATSAAQAAAESAEMASMAARAAAELARHGKVTREYPAESHASSFHRPRNEGPGRSTDWKFTDAHDEEDSSRTENGSPGSFHGAKPRIQNKERGETGQDLLSRAAASRYNDFGKANKSSSRHVSSHTKATSIDDNIASANHQKMDGFSPKSLAGVKAINQNLQGKDYENDSVGEGSFKIQSGRHTSTNSGMGSLHGEVFVVGQKTDSFSQKGFSEVKSLNQNWQNTKIEVDDHPGVGSFQEQSSNSTLSNSYMSPISSDDIWDRNAQSYDDVNQFSINTAGQGNTKRGTEKPGLSDSSEVVFDESGWDVNQFSINTGGGNTERGTEKPELSDFSGVVFDESGSDSDTHLDLKNDSTRHHFDSYFPTQGAPSSSHLTSGIDPLSTKQWRGESHLMDGSRIFVESTETIADATVPKQSDALLAATFDGSDGMNSETEEEGDSLKLREGMKSSSSSGKRNVSTIGLSSSRPTVSYFDKKEEDKEVNRNAWSHTSSDDSDLDEVPSKSNQEATLNVVGGSWKRYDQGDLLTNQLSPRRTRTARKSSDLSQEAAFTSMVENQQLLQPLTLPSDKEVAKKDKFGAQSSPPSSEESELSYNLSSKDGNELNLGRLTGGFRNKGFSRRSYVRGHLANTSASSTEQMADGTPTITDKPTILSSDKTSVSSNTKTLFDSDSDEAEVQPLRTGRSGGYRGVMLSRRTKDSPRQSVTSSPLKFNGRSEALVTSDFGVESGLSRPSSSVGEPVAKLANKNVFSESADNVKLTLPNSSIEQPYKLDAAMIEKSTISSSDKKSMHSEARENRLNNRKPHVNAPEELISTPKSDSDSDNDDSEVIFSRQTAGSRGHRNATLSRRRGDSPSQLEMDSPQKFSGRSDVPVSSDFGAGSRFSTSSSSVSETLSKPPTETVISGSRQNLKPVQPASSIRRPSKFLPPAEISVRKESMQSSQPSSFSKQPLKPSSGIGMSGRDESQKSLGSSGGSASRENSLKTASHVHPKLPDYDILAARLESLRSDRRSQ